MLTFKRSDNLKVIGYSNLDFAGCVDNRKSIFGYLFMLAEGAISWKSSKQTITAASTMEVEFMACFEATVYGLRLWNFISRLGIVSSISSHKEFIVIILQLCFSLKTISILMMRNTWN